MKIVKATKGTYFKEKSMILENCYLVLEGKFEYHYEFLITNKEAEIVCDSLEYLENVVEFFHKEHPYINKYYTKDHSFFMNFDKIFTFMLPINIIQVSKVFLDQERLEKLKNYEEDLQFIFPVQIVEEEYVLLNRHHQLFLANEEGMRMVEVFMSNDFSLSNDYLYLAKEQNIKTIKDMQLISHNEYEEIQEQLKYLF